MAYLIAGCVTGLFTAVAIIVSGGGLLAALLAYSLGGAAATVGLALACAVTMRTGAALPPHQLEGPAKRLA